MIAASAPLVTVITPTFNRAAYLPQTIDSVLSQDYRPVQYLVLDDGSSDHTPQLLSRFNGALESHRHDNRGEQRTVNRGFELARGEYVMVVNSDDPLRPGAISAMVQALERDRNLAAAYPDWELIDEHDGVVRSVQVPEFDYERMLALHQCLVGPGAMIRRSALQKSGGRNVNFRYVADFDLWLRLGLVGPMQRVPYALATWRTHETTASGHLGPAMAREHVRMIDEFFQQPDLPAHVQAWRKRAMGWAHYAAAFHAGSAHATRVNHLLRFMLQHPGNLNEAWRRLRREKPAQNPWKLILRRLRGVTADV